MSYEFAEDQFVVTNSAAMDTHTGGQRAKDILYVDQSATNTGAFTMSGIEYLVVGNDTGASTVDLTNVTGLKDIALHDTGGTGAKITVNKLAAGVTVTLGNGSNEFKAQTADINLADATGTADSITINLLDTDEDTP